MYKVFLTYILFSLILQTAALSQYSTEPVIPGYSYHPYQEDKESWQRLNLWMSSTFLNIVKEGQADLDSCLDVASHSLGLSRFAMLAEGIDDPDLFKQSQWIDRHDPARGIRLLSGSAGIKHLQLLILLGSYYAFQTGTYNRYRDSVSYFLNKAISESKSMKAERLGRQALCLLAKIYVQVNDPKGDTICNLLINQCRQAGDKTTEARILAYRGIYTPAMPATLQRKIADLHQASNLYHSLGDTTAEINVLTDLGYLQMITQNLQQAYENFQQALNLAEANHYPYTHYNTQALASVTIFQGKFGEPLKYVYQTIRVAENTRDSLGWSYFYSSLSLLLTAEGRLKESFEVAQKSVKRFVADRNTSVYNMLNEVVNYMSLEGRAKEALDLTVDIANKVGMPTTYTDQFFYHYLFSNCYLNLEMPDQAEMHIKKLDALETKAEVIRGPVRRYAVNIQYALLFTKRKKYLKAREIFEKHIAGPSGMDASLTMTLDVYRWLIAIDSVLGDNAAGMVHYKKYFQLLDSSFRVAKIRQAEELQVMYQMQEKENHITLLTQQTKLEKANSQKADLVKNITVAGIFIAMIITGLLYRQNRQKQKNNEVITGKNGQLQQLLADKEWLVKEIHHRVKNNLQIIMSLLDSQAEYMDNEAALTGVHDNLRRVHAMALIHQKLYLSEGVSSIAMAEYINELVIYIRDSFDLDNQINFEQTIEPIDIDVSQAIPLGLIINESLVNAIKYAFPNERKGTVYIKLYRDGSDHIVLKISDNGPGLPPGLNLKAHKSLGFDLMQGLTRQLNGSFNIENNNGLHITIRFIVLNYQASDKALI